MIKSYNFLKSILDTINQHVAVIDSEGDILYINKTWRLFGIDNACTIDEKWKGINYLRACDQSADMGDEFGAKAAIGIRLVIEGDEDEFYFEYPCHSPDERRWFMMHVTPFTIQGDSCFVISHQNITTRKLAEEEVLNLSRMDGLTDIPNRRYFDEFLDGEWKRCHRLGLPISLAMIDLDNFKLLNDTYGHQAGDECLKSVGKILKKFGKRPSDICARYGGEEFALVYGNTNLEQASILVENLLKEIRSLRIPNKKSPTLPILTASIGLSTMYPNDKNSLSDLVKRSDEFLYSAKESGRNKICFSHSANA